MQKIQIITGFAALLLVGVACGTPPPQGPDGGAGGGQVILCSAPSDCPGDLPVCSGGVCSPEGTGDCTSDADCSGGICNQLTNKCEICSNCCDTDTDCGLGKVCTAGFCEDAGAACTDADGCEPGEICKNGNCRPFDEDALCTVGGDDCPRDHQCNSLAGDRCEGCVNDVSCINSTHGPKCDQTDDGVGPGPGYCWKECGDPADPRDCPTGSICDVDRGGLCIPACDTNADCLGGQVCVGGKCGACATDAQCDPPKVCGQNNTCVAPPQCSDTECKKIGAEFYCDTGTNSCLKGCDDAVNPCPGTETCNTTTHQCEGGGGGGCTACSTDCSLLGQVCDTVTCSCVAPGGGGGGGGAGNAGDPCFFDTDCEGGLVCGSLFPGLIEGQCGIPCNIDNLCICPDFTFCKSFDDALVDTFMCLFGIDGVCVP